LEAIQKGVLKIRPKSEKKFEDYKDICFVFKNGGCSISADYSAQISWGPEQSEELLIPCGKKEEYFTGYGGGDVKIIVWILNRDTVKSVQQATVTLTQPDGGCSSKRIPWK